MGDNINLKINGKETKVSIVRYFLSSEQRYLIYTLGETDDAGYVKLYVSKMEYDPLRAVSITDEDEWNKIKDLIKITIKENKQKSSLSIIDLNYADIENIEVVDSKIFKLLDSMVEILASNKTLFEDYGDVVLDQQAETKEKVEKNGNEIDYKDLYHKEIENRKLVEDDLKKATKVIEEFRKKLKDINDLLKQD